MNPTTSQSGQRETASSNTTVLIYLSNIIPGISWYAVVSISKHVSLVSHTCDTETCHEPFYALSKAHLNDVKVLVAEIMKCTDLWYANLRGLLEVYPGCVFVPWMWRQQKSPKRRYMGTKFHSVTLQKPKALSFLYFIVHHIRSTYFPSTVLCFTVPSDVFDCTVL
jgi:hypothetical protein